MSEEAKPTTEEPTKEEEPKEEEESTAQFEPVVSPIQVNMFVWMGWSIIAVRSERTRQTCLDWFFNKIVWLFCSIDTALLSSTPFESVFFYQYMYLTIALSSIALFLDIQFELKRVFGCFLHLHFSWIHLPCHIMLSHSIIIIIIR